MAFCGIVNGVLQDKMSFSVFDDGYKMFEEYKKSVVEELNGSPHDARLKPNVIKLKNNILNG